MLASASAPVEARSAAVEYRPAIDGLRAIAVLAVFLFHLNRQWLPGGFVGVDVFFVISGYLITSIVLRDCERGRFRFGRFYQRRIARLLPAFFAVGLATLIGAALIYSAQDLASAAATLSAAAGYVANLKFMFQGNYFTLSPDAQPFLHCWSLSVEEQFYLFFPAAFLLIYRTAGEYKTRVLTALFALSLVACIALTPIKPVWAFYLLPTRAWELCAGSILATLRKRPSSIRIPAKWAPFAGVVLIAISFWTISDGPAFPSWRALMPVVGTCCFLLPWDHAGGLVERALSWDPLALVGRMSYSLYLWHWPVFSLVDYQLYWQPASVRIVLKILISILASTASFMLIEKPARVLLNRPDKRRLTFALLAASLVILIPLGVVVRNANYINAGERDVRSGGRSFNEAGRNGSMILMGDSNASMYGKMAVEIAKERDLKLRVISVAAGDPLPHSAGRNPQLWTDSFAVVQSVKPDFLVLVCNWEKLQDDPNRMTVALQELRPYAHFIFLITQPPALPETASRDGIRNGNRPPFLEDAKKRTERLGHNGYVKTYQRDNVRVIDIEPLFSKETGEIRTLDSQRRQVFQDEGHLSAIGAEMVKPKILEAMSAAVTGAR
jgi:peptidoglycan/LPS O-acetylase OafA/YrhL